MGNSEIRIAEHLGQCCLLYKVVEKWLSKSARIVMQENTSTTENGYCGLGRRLRLESVCGSGMRT